MKAARFVGVGQPVVIEDLPKPTPSRPDEVIVRIAGAGVCRTDLHILEGAAPLQPAPPPPFTLGHENAGWIETVGPAVSHLHPGDPVILHPAITCGVCLPCRQGNDMYCANTSFPGVDGSDGGFAELLRTSARAVVALPSGTDPAPLAPLADAGLTAYHAVARIAGLLKPGSVALVVGVGGLGHIAIQLLRALTPAKVVALDLNPERLELARQLGAAGGLLADDPDRRQELSRWTGGSGADVVLDFVAEGKTPELALSLLRRGGTYSIVGYGGTLTVRTVDMIVNETNILGNFVGSYRDLVELMELHRQGLVRVSAHRYSLPDAAKALDDLSHGRVLGRAVLIP